MKHKCSQVFFNYRLFVEGLKRLRVIGVATAIISFSISALIPIVTWLGRSPNDHTQIIPAEQVCIPLYFTVCMAPFFFMTLFSYLYKRKESDLFHAIPYTRTCVYVSFVAAGLAMIFAIQIISAGIASVLWFANEYTVFSVVDFIPILLNGMLCAAFLSGIMLLATTLTGTPLTTILLFGIFCFLPRLVAWYFGAAIDANLDVLDSVSMHYLRFDWFLPFSYLSSGVGGYSHTAYRPNQDPACIIYTIVLTLIAFGASWLLYRKRKSEMAGMTTSGNLSQHIFRCLFALPLALLIPVLAMKHYIDFAIGLVLVVLTLIVYYLYELITTKKIRNLISATPWLVALGVCIFMFVGSVYIVSGIVLNTPIKAQDVFAIGIQPTDISLYDTYQQQQIQDDSATTDADFIEKMCSSYATTLQCNKSGDYHSHYQSATTWRQVTFYLKNGQKIQRYVCFTREDAKKVNHAYLNKIDMQEKILELPQEFSVTYNISGTYYVELDALAHCEAYHVQILDIYSFRQVYDQIYEEYTALSMEEQYGVRSDMPDQYMGVKDNCAYLTINFKTVQSEKEVQIHIYIDERMPKSLALLKEFINMPDAPL